MSGFSVLHCLPEFAQTHVHWVGGNHPTISSSVVPFSSCPQSSLASGSFPVSRLFPSAGQSIGASASASVLPMNSQGWFPLGLTGLISLLSKSLLQHRSSKASILQCSASFMVQLSHLYVTTGKTIALTRRTSVGKVMSWLLILSRFVIGRRQWQPTPVFLPRGFHGQRSLVAVHVVARVRYDWETKPPPAQFKSVNFLVLSLLYGPTLVSVHDYWKNHSFDVHVY